MEGITCHRANCLDVLPDLPAGSIDMILVDPPYAATKQSWDVVIPYADFWREHNRVIKDNGAMVVTANLPFGALLIESNLKYFRYDLVWAKNKITGYLNANRMPLRQHELILVFYKKPPVFNPQKTNGHKPVNSHTKKPYRNRVYGTTTQEIRGGGATDRFPTSLLRFGVVNNDDPERVHTNQKPVDMLRWLIRTYTNPGDVVLDSCMGSGSTGVAALLEARQFVGIELDYTTYRTAVGRIQKHRALLDAKSAPVAPVAPATD